MIPAIELVEHAPATGHILPDAVGRALAAARIVDPSPDPYTPGRWLLRAGSKVGAVSVDVPGGGSGPVTVRVTPKVPIARLFFLLGYSLDPKGGWRDGQVDAAEHREVLPALGHAVERQIDRALRQGLLQGYLATEEVEGRRRKATDYESRSPQGVRQRLGALLSARGDNSIRDRSGIERWMLVQVDRAQRAAGSARYGYPPQPSGSCSPRRRTRR
ncbi:hypothetical protein [Streptomyces sp. NPDC048496]|uniref:hypothetical protein n=1 Tax=Streptomyces sp. NPDC048496 TaxID=3365558 RepID=UPI00371B5B40